MTIERAGAFQVAHQPDYPADLSPEDMRVALYAEVEARLSVVYQSMTMSGKIISNFNGYIYDAALYGQRPAGYYMSRVMSGHMAVCVSVET